MTVSEYKRVVLKDLIKEVGMRIRDEGFAEVNVSAKWEGDEKANILIYRFLDKEARVYRYGKRMEGALVEAGKSLEKSLRRIPFTKLEGEDSYLYYLGEIPEEAVPPEERGFVPVGNRPIFYPGDDFWNAKRFEEAVRRYEGSGDIPDEAKKAFLGILGIHDFSLFRERELGRVFLQKLSWAKRLIRQSEEYRL